MIGCYAAWQPGITETKSHLGPCPTDWCMTGWRWLWVITLVLVVTSIETTPKFETNMQFLCISIPAVPTQADWHWCLCIQGKVFALAHAIICLEQMHTFTVAIPPSNSFFFSSSNQHFAWEVLTAVSLYSWKCLKKSKDSLLIMEKNNPDSYI